MKTTKTARLARRHFLKSLLATAAGLGLAHLEAGHGLSRQDDPPSIYLPLLVSHGGPAAQPGRVVHVHASSATDWDFDADHYYGKTQATGVVGVNQAVVDAMMTGG
jgi:hypothetical protein